MVERGRLEARKLISETIPLEMAFDIIERMSTCENAGISLIKQF